MAGQGSYSDGGSAGERTIASIHSDSVERTRQLGAALGTLLRRGDIVLLQGDLGAGKTALTQGIGSGLGVRGVINSPTFTILKEYAGRLPLYHFDLYRIESVDEFYSLGFDDYLWGEGVSVVEWPERIEHAEQADEVAPWAADHLRLRLSRAGQDQRRIEADARGARGIELGASWASAARES